MKKIGIILSLLFLSACSLSNTPSGKVEAYLNQFNSLSDSVTQDRSINKTVQRYEI